MRRRFLSVMLTAVLCANLLAAPALAEEMGVQPGPTGDGQTTEIASEIPGQDGAAEETAAPSGISEGPGSTDPAEVIEEPGNADPAETSAEPGNTEVNETSGEPEGTGAPQPDEESGDAGGEKTEANQQEPQTVSAAAPTGELSAEQENNGASQSAVTPKSTAVPENTGALKSVAAPKPIAESKPNGVSEISAAPTSLNALEDGVEPEETSTAVNSAAPNTNEEKSTETEAEQENADGLTEESAANESDAEASQDTTAPQEGTDTKTEVSGMEPAAESDAGLMTLAAPESEEAEPVAAAETSIQGAAGPEAVYQYDATAGILTFSGTGALTSMDWSIIDEGQKVSVVIGEGITSIENDVFSFCNEITSIVIPEGVTEIESDTFQSCSGLTEIQLPESLTSIGVGAFEACSALRRIVLPSNVKSIGQAAFMDCTGLAEVKLPANLVSIGANAFAGCSSLTKLELPSTLESIEQYEFENSGLTEIILPSNLKEIPYGAFYGCSNLKKVKMEANNIDASAFENCVSLEEVTLSSNIQTVDPSAFLSCHNLSKITFFGTGELTTCLRTDDDSLEGVSVVVEEGITSIGTAFKLDAFITSITLPESVTEIDPNAFSNCRSLTNVTLPDSLTSIGYGAFSSCESLKQITLPSGLKSIGYRSFGNSGLTEITIPGSVSEMWGAFKDVLNLQKVVISDGITRVDEEAFAGCGSLVEISLPVSLKEIGGQAFTGCGNLTEITLPDSVSEVGESAFAFCGLKSVHLSKGLKSIPMDMFRGCLNLEEITIPDTVTQIGNAAFMMCTDLASVHLPQSLKEISDSAFYSCESLSEIVIPSTVTEIGWGAFMDCTNLTTVSLPDTLRSLGGNAFAYCTMLSNINLPAGLSVIGEHTFRDCINLRNVTFPNGVTRLAYGAFRGCTSLANVHIPESVSAIEYRVFEGCDSMTNVALPNTLKSIGGYAFGYRKSETPELRNGFTIYGYTGSSAESYATEYSVPFVAVTGWNSSANGNYYSYIVEPSASSLTYTLNSEGNVVIECTGHLKDFIRLLVDGKEVDPSNYTKAEGSTILTLLSNYLDTLSVGDHPAQLEYTNGIAECTITILAKGGDAAANTPQTTSAPQSTGGAALTSTPISSTVQTATITMLMVDTSGQPMTSLNLELHSTPKSAVTDSSGYATFYDVEGGLHTLTAKDKDGKVTGSKQFELTFGSVTSISGDRLTVPAGSRLVLTVQMDGNEMKLVSATQVQAASTGDSAAPMFWLVLACAALCVLCGAGFYRVRNRAR